MDSEQLLQQKLPLAMEILGTNGIVPGQYSVCAFVKDDGESGCRVSPAPGNSGLFTVQVQEDLTAAGFLVQITT